MSQFWIGYLAAIGTYLAIGVGVGIYVVMTNLARFHGGGFQWARMAQYVMLLALLWPGAVEEFFARFFLSEES